MLNKNNKFQNDYPIGIPNAEETNSLIQKVPAKDRFEGVFNIIHVLLVLRGKAQQ